LVNDGIEAYFRTLRDGRRYANTAPAALKVIGREVASTDVLALEAMRLFDADVHAALPGLVDVLTGRSAPDVRSEGAIEAEHRERVASVMERSSNRRATTTLLTLLFPAAAHLFGGSRYAGEQQHWLKAQRVASRTILERYIHTVLGPRDASIADIEDVVAAIDDPSSLRRRLEDVESERLGDLLQGVRLRLSERPPHDIREPALAFIEIAPAMSLPASFFEVGPMRRALWVVDTLLLTVQKPAERVDVVRWLIAHVPTLSARWYVLMRYGTWSEDGSREPELDILDIDESGTEKHRLAAAVLDADAQALAAEPELLRLLRTVHDSAEDGHAAVLERLQDDGVLRSALALTVGTAESSNEFGGRRYSHVDRDSLINLAGEDQLVARLRRLDPQGDEKVEAAVRAILEGAR
jgi:hypothetical protein